MGQIQSLAELLGLLWRRKWLILMVFVLGTVAAAFFAKSRPDLFEAIAVIQVESPLVAAPGSPGTAVAGGGATAVLLQSIQQRLTTRDGMIAMIERHALFADLPGLSVDQKVGILRASISFQSIASVMNQSFGAPTSLSALTITARLGDAEQSARVANDLAQSVLDQGSAGQDSRARDTLLFFEAEETRIWNEILALETEISEFKNRNADALPAQQATRQAELVSIDAELRALDQSRLALIAQREALQAQGNLRTTQQRQLDTLNAGISQLDQQAAGLTDRRALVETTQSQGPEVERALSGYDRRLQQLQDQHSVVNQRLAEAQTAQRLAQNQQAERFALLERAVTPEYPLGSGGKKLVIAGALGSLGLGFALAFVLDLMRPVVRTAAQMQRQVGLHPVVCIPDLPLRRPSRRKLPPVRLSLDKTRQVLMDLPKSTLALACGAVLVATVSAFI